MLLCSPSSSGRKGAATKQQLPQSIYFCWPANPATHHVHSDKNKNALPCHIPDILLAVFHMAANFGMLFMLLMGSLLVGILRKRTGLHTQVVSMIRCVILPTHLQSVCSYWCRDLGRTAD